MTNNLRQIRALKAQLPCSALPFPPSPHCLPWYAKFKLNYNFSSSAACSAPPAPRVVVSKVGM